MNSKSIKFLEKIEKRGFVLGLENIEKTIDLLDINDLKVIHVAGTNGKGSVCNYMDSVLKEAGYKVGLYTSPSLVRFNERVKVNDKEISDEDIDRILEEIEKLTEENNIPITLFEAETALASKYFSEQKCDIVIFEVGMGGRLDATNYLKKPLVCMITSISMDHTDFLGDTIEKIAGEKAGIIKEGVNVFSYMQAQGATEVLKNKAKEKNAPIEFLIKDDVKNIEFNECYTKFDFKDRKNIKLSLIGDYQPFNASLAILGLDYLKEKNFNITEENLYNGLEKARNRGRLEVIKNEDSSKTIIIDGGHNKEGAQSLVSSLKNLYGDRKFTFVYGSLRDKDYQSIIDLVGPISKNFLTVRPDNLRALSSIDLKNAILNKGYNATAFGSTKLALKSALNSDDDIIVVFGSLYLIREVYEYLNI